MRAHTSKTMDPNLIRSMGAEIEAQLATFKPKKGRGRVQAFTSITVAMPPREIYLTFLLQTQC